MPAPLNLVNQKFGRLLVIAKADNPKKHSSRWLCLCDCGVYKNTSGYLLTSQQTKSCGCLRKEVTSAQFTKHKFSATPIYRVWQGMKKRCNYPGDVGWENYGGRGITVCAQWQESFETFLEDVGKPPFPRAQLDRIDNGGNYEPNNVHWVTNQQNSINRRNSVQFTYNGLTLHVQEWSKKLGISCAVLRFRRKNGWSTERTLTQAVQKRTCIKQ
jgi:hypothetical protein